MQLLQLVAVHPPGNGPGGWLESGKAGLLPPLARQLSRTFGCRCEVGNEPLDPTFAYDQVRNQYHSTRLLEELARRPGSPLVTRLGVAAVDLFVPIFTYVFGEAQVGGSVAVVSVHRLREEFYGLPPDSERLALRLFKEAAHEVGHLQGLRHCASWECLMASSHAVEAVDLKSARFCPRCERQAVAPPPTRRVRVGGEPPF